MSTTRPTSAPAIEVAGLGKSFNDNHVLKGIDFTVPAGTVYALLGPNGAGKTTAVRILTTLINGDAGTAMVLGPTTTRWGSCPNPSVTTRVTGATTPKPSSS